MTRESILGKNNPFYKARIASNKDDFKNRRDTAENIYISRRQLEEIETGKREPYPDEILIMAEAYDAPYLVEHYCNHICKIGQKFGCKYVENKGDAYKATVMFIKSLKEAEQAKENILEILSDGKISKKWNINVRWSYKQAEWNNDRYYQSENSIRKRKNQRG